MDSSSSRFPTPSNSSSADAGLSEDLLGSGRGYLDEVVARLPCFEPAGGCLELTVGDLVENVLTIGSVGSGKSSGPLARILDGALRFRAASPEEKLGLVILDFKADDTVARVRALAAQAGRADDVVVIDGSTRARLRTFAAIREFSDVSDFVSKLTSLNPSLSGENNSFWETSRRNLVEAILIVLLAQHPSLSLEQTIQEISGWMDLEGRKRRSASPEMVRLTELAKSPELPTSTRLVLTAALRYLAMWSTLECRTASNLLPCVLNLFSGLLDPTAARYVGGGLAEEDPTLVDLNAVITHGRIVVISLSEGAHPDLARWLGSFAKAELYAAVARRSPGPRSRERAVLLFLDEYPLVATGNHPRFGDIPVLQTGRSRRLGVVAAAQGLSSLRLRLPAGQLPALLLNFVTLILLRGSDPLTDEYAEQVFGRDSAVAPRRPSPDALPWSDERVACDSPSAPSSGAALICPAGRLSRLEPFQAMVKTGRGVHSREPLWLVPLFVALPENPHPSVPTGLGTSLLSPRDQVLMLWARMCPDPDDPSLT